MMGHSTVVVTPVAFKPAFNTAVHLSSSPHRTTHLAPAITRLPLRFRDPVPVPARPLFLPLPLPLPFLRLVPKSHVSHAHSHSHSHSHSEPATQIQTQTQPQAETSSHSRSPCSSGCHSAAVVVDPTNPVTTFLSKLAAFRSSSRLAISTAILLLLSGLLRISAALASFHIVPLCGIIALAGIPAVADASLAITSDRSAALSVEVLMTISVVASVVTGALFEAGLLLTLFGVSLTAEESVSARAARHIDNLLRRASPKTALRLATATSSEPTTVELSSVRPGDLLLVPVGKAAPCDGIVIESPVLVSVSQITGESVPIAAAVGDNLNAGSVPQDSPLVLRVTREAGESFLARMARLVDDGLKIRPAVQRFFDKFGNTYTRIVLLLAIATALLLPFLSTWLGPLLGISNVITFYGKSGSISRALGFLVVASPCALIIGAPIAYTAALSACAQKGVLVKGGSKALGSAASTSHVVFDKTGTLTTGQLELVSAHRIAGSHSRQKNNKNKTQNYMSNTTSSYLHSLHSHDHHHRPLQQLTPLNDAEQRRVVCAAAALERGAVHPIADAIRTKARQLGGEMPQVGDARVVSGQGVEGDLTFSDSSSQVYGRLGRPSFILGDEDQNLLSELNADAADNGETVSVLSVDDELYVLRMRDEVREEASSVVSTLVDNGMEVSVLTGDANGAANFVCDAMLTTGGGEKKRRQAITMVSDATPREKMDYVAGLGDGVMMIGDGINDGAALAAAPVGVAFGLSSATTVDAAQVVLVRQDLNDIAWLLRKARATESIVRQNIVVALGLMVISALACVSGTVPLWLAVTLHEGGTLLVGMNGLRLLGDK